MRSRIVPVLAIVCAVVFSGCGGHGGALPPTVAQGSQGILRSYAPNVEQTYSNGGMASFPLANGHVAVNPIHDFDGNVWFIDKPNAAAPGGNAVGKVTERGVITEYPSPGAAPCISQLVANATGTLVALDDCSAKIDVITTMGVYKQYAYPSGIAATSCCSAQNLPQGAVVGADGFFYFLSGTSSSYQMNKMTITTGVIVQYPNFSVGLTDAPTSLIVGPDKMLYAFDNNSILKFNTTTHAFSSFSTAPSFEVVAGTQGLVSWKNALYVVGMSQGANEYSLDAVTTAGVVSNVWTAPLTGSPPPLQLPSSSVGAAWALVGKDGNLYLGMLDVNGMLEIWRVTLVGTTYTLTQLATIPGNSASYWNGAALGGDGNFWLSWNTPNIAVYQNYNLNPIPTSFSFHPGTNVQLLQVVETASGGALTATSENTSVATVAAVGTAYPGLFFVTKTGQGLTSIDVKDAQSNYISVPVSVNNTSFVPPPPTISLYAGNFNSGNQNGNGAGADFNSPTHPSIDINGNIYVVDAAQIRNVTPGAPPSLGSFAAVTGVASAVDFAGNVYVSDAANNVIRKYTPAGVGSVLAGKSGTAGHANGTGIAATFNNPQGIAVDKSGNVYVSDAGNYAIRKITSTGVVTTLAGKVTVPGMVNGTGIAAEFMNPFWIAVDLSGNVYVTDSSAVIRKVTSTGVVTTFAGSLTIGHMDGIGASAQFSGLTGLACDYSGNLYATEANEYDIREITPTGLVSTIAGQPGISGPPPPPEGNPMSTYFSNVNGLAVDRYGNIFIADQGFSVLREITP